MVENERDLTGPVLEGRQAVPHRDFREDVARTEIIPNPQTLEARIKLVAQIIEKDPNVHISGGPGLPLTVHYMRPQLPRVHREIDRNTA